MWFSLSNSPGEKKIGCHVVLVMCYNDLQAEFMVKCGLVSNQILFRRIQYDW